MQPDCYKVEVLHLTNPYLIWVEVRDPAIVFAEHDIKFEQVGIYGVLPMEATIQQHEEKVTYHRCQEWQPAATTLIREFLADEEDVYFTPLHLDRRSSIFDDNIHKFGDIFIINKKNGKNIYLTKVLKSSGFADFVPCVFYQFLSMGLINTKLSNIETHNVLTEIEKYFIRKNVPRNKWEDPIKSQTSVARVSYELEEALTTTNVDKHNKNMKAILENKNKDLELCKGVDEPSLGRGSTRKVKQKNKKTPVEKKLELLNAKKTNCKLVENKENKTYEHAQAFEDIKDLVDTNASRYSKKISSKTDAQKAQILKKIMSKNAEKLSTIDELLNNESKYKNHSTEEELRKPVNHIDDSFSNSNITSSSTETNYIPNRKQLIEKEEIAVSKKKDGNICSQIETNIKLTTPHQEQPPVKIQNTHLNVKKNQVGLSESKMADRHLHHNRRSLKGKSTKKLVKAEVKAAAVAPQELSDNFQSNAALETTMSPQQKPAYIPQNMNRVQEYQHSKRVPELPHNLDSHLLFKKPIHEYTVSEIMNGFKLTGSKYSDKIQNCLKKSKNLGKSNSDTIAALIECRMKIIEETKELERQEHLSNIGYDLPLSQVIPKCNLKKRGKTHNSNSAKDQIAFGPPGIDLSTLNRVPPVVLYGEETSSNDGQTSADNFNKAKSFSDEDFDVNISSDKALAKCSYINKIADDMGANEKEARNKRNESRHDRQTKRLKLHKEMARTRRSSQTSATTTKDSSNSEEKSPPKNFVNRNMEDNSDNDSIAEIVEKMGLSYKKNILNAEKDLKKMEYLYQLAAIKANPFQNYDTNLSIFVEQLITPIMLVHSKMNRRFIATGDFRDINFSDHIQLVLKNLGVEHPMMIQSITWNSILRGYSVFMVGPASSGKTVGYLPSVCRLVTDFHESEPYCDSVGPFCIIVCATSQSVSEIDRVVRMLVGCDEKVISCYYGHDELLITTSLLNGCDILITTAPYLVRLLHMTNFAVDLQRLATLVFDDCERLSKVYLSEIKFCLHKVKEMLKLRVNKELQVQYIVASRIWCNFMESFARKAPNAVVCIRAYQECVLYSKTNMTVSYVKEKNKLHHLLDFLEHVDPSKKTVVVCDLDEEVDFLNRAIHNAKYFIFTTNSNMTVQDLYNVTLLWREFREPQVAPIMVCRDANLYHMNIVDANYLVHYSMPPLYSVFCRRFATLNECYPSIFRSDNPKIKILILLGENNVAILPKILNFVKRCTNDVPDFLDNICESVLAERDLIKAENHTPLCGTLMSLGECPELLTCKNRHTIFKNYDTPKEWVPKSGEVTFKIIHYHSAAHYSARLIGNFIDGTQLKFPPTYSHMSLTMGMHYAKEQNRIPFGIPKVGDICAVALRNNLFCRCQVIKLLYIHDKGNPNYVLVNLLDEEILNMTPVISLYHLPDQFKAENTYVLHVRLANIQPNDKDIVLSTLARDMVQEAIESKRSVYMKGKIVFTVSNCIFVDTLEVCQDLKSLNETVVIYNVKRELLAKHAIVSPHHLPKIQGLCERAGIELKSSENVINKTTLLKVKPNISWAYLEDDMLTVEFGSILSPHTIFVRLTKFEDCLKTLISDIQKFAASNTGILNDFEKGDIVLAEYPVDCFYERARIDEIDKETVKCFFVDQGEWCDVTKDKLRPISDTLVTQLPFQAIECRLVGVKPSGDQWTDFSTNWFYDKCFETEGGTVKQLYIKYFVKEPAKFTGDHKYGVIIVDTYANEDLIINQLMIDLNLADEVDDEIKYLVFGKFKNTDDAICNYSGEDDISWEKVSKYSSNFASKPDQTHNILLSQPIRSVPLVETDDDSDDSEKWNINMTDDMAKIFKPFAEYPKCNVETTLPAIENNGNDIIEEIDVNSLYKNIKECAEQFEHVKINADTSNELDSDDLSSPETAQSANEVPEKIAEAVNGSDQQLRKPKLNWRQTKTSVALKIQLIGVDKYDLKIQDRSLTFTATLNDTYYGFEIELYGVIDKITATHSNKGQYILVKFNKIMPKNWLTLTKDGGIRKWIVYDVDSIDTSSDEEEIRNDDLYNIVRNANNNTDSDSDDDLNYGAVDDVSYEHKKNY